MTTTGVLEDEFDLVARWTEEVVADLGPDYAVAAGQALPFGTGAFDSAWCLGVLDTAGDKAALLAEVRRVLGGTGRLGLLALEQSARIGRLITGGHLHPTLLYAVAV